LGLVVLENKLKQQSQPTIEILKEAKVRTIMATGDNLMTAVAIAKQSSILNKEKPVLAAELEKDQLVWYLDGVLVDKLDFNLENHQFAITGPTFKHIRS
jgi:magnesium-transporting ATPase (P-type)